MATKLAQKVAARIHQSQNPTGESKNQNSPYGSWIRGLAGAASGPDKPRLQQHEPSANNGGGKMFPGLGKRLGGPLKPRR